MRFSHVVAFVLGAGVGGASAYYFLKTKFEKIAQEEIESIKESYHVPQPFVDKPEEEHTDEHTDENKEKAEMAREKKDINEYAKILHENNYHPRYSDTSEKKVEEPEDLDFEYISPDELGENDEYTIVDLVYYADGILADEGDEVVEDFMERVGNFTTHFGEYDDDAVYVRNDERKLYYEIVRDNRFYTDVVGSDINDEEE